MRRRTSCTRTGGNCRICPRSCATSSPSPRSRRRARAGWRMHRAAPVCRGKPRSSMIRRDNGSVGGHCRTRRCRMPARCDSKRRRRTVGPRCTCGSPMTRHSADRARRSPSCLAKSPTFRCAKICAGSSARWKRASCRRSTGSHTGGEMDTLCWYGKEDVRVEDVPEPTILNPRDAIVRITTTAICGSDLHMYDGYIAGLKPGDILGHEFMGEIVDVGPGVKNLAVGDRVVVPFGIYCGRCESCRRGLWAMCDNSNENASVVEAAYGFSGAALFGYSHLYGGYAGGQAQFARVPFADVGPVKVPDGLRDEQVIFLTDILPTGYQAAEQCGIRPGDVVAIWGCGPVGQFAIQSAYLLGADRVIAIDRVPERLAMARDVSHAETIDYSEVEDVVEALKQLTGGRGPDHCIDA